MNHSGEIIAPGIMLFENVIDNGDEIIDKALSQNSWRDEIINIGSTKIFDINFGYRMEDFWFAFSKKIFFNVDKYAINFNFSFKSMENIQIIHYKNNQSSYSYHVDDGPGMNRVCSSVLYLNDVDEGGETHFEHFDISIQPKMGRMLVFPANYVYSHQASMPISNDKFAAVTWFEKANI